MPYVVRNNSTKNYFLSHAGLAKYYQKFISVWFCAQYVQTTFLKKTSFKPLYEFKLSDQFH